MKKFIFILLISVFIFTGSAFCLGPKVVKHTATWDANTESDLAGYYLYWRTPTGTFSDINRVTVIKTASPSFDLLTLGLPAGTYVIAVSAYNTAGNEGGLSNEATYDGNYPSSPKNTKVQ